MSLHIVGSTDTILRSVKVIFTGYPDCITFNMESRIIYGKFLNIRIYNDPTCSVLWKPNNKYSITPPSYNTPYLFKRMAGLTYFRTTRMHPHPPKSWRTSTRLYTTYFVLKVSMQSFAQKCSGFEQNLSLDKTFFNDVSSSQRHIQRLAFACRCMPD